MESDYPLLRFFGRRKSKPIRPSRQLLLQDLLPRIRLDDPERMKESFGITPKEVWLEVGFGGGEHLAHLCKKYADIAFVGAEPFLNGVASLLAHLNGSHMGPVVHTGMDSVFQDNIRIYPDDIRQIWGRFPDKSFERIYVLYPDPWPKARHANRRFMNPENLKEMARLLTDTGHIELATDMPFYMQWALDNVQASGLFRATEAVQTPPYDWMTTRYEQKALANGRTPLYALIFKK